MTEITLNANSLVAGIGLLVGITSVAFKIFDRGDSKRTKIYERIEQERKDADDNYTSTELCGERSGNITGKLEEIGKDVKVLLKTNGH